MTTGLFAVFGHPVAHSLSPLIHAAFAEQTGMDMRYKAIDAAADTLPQALRDFAAQGGAGANLTAPHKQAVLPLCASLSERARRAGAVNTMIRTNHAWHGENTDGIGLVRDLTERHGLDLRERRTLLLGAGGAAHGVAPSLLESGIGELFIVNRTPQRADALMDQLGEPGRVHSRYWRDLAELGEFDLIVDATSGAPHADALDLPAALAGPRTVAVSLRYGAAATPFLAWARAHSVLHALDGLGMLVEQAAESFALWHGVKPQTQEIYHQLRAQAAR